MTGNVDADKVILRENITLAGGYTQVGNLTKSQNGTSIFSTKGKSVMDALTEIFSKRLQPSTAQPSIGAFTLTGAGAVEAGTKTKDTAAYTPFRNVFYGTSTGKPALDSAAIRALGKTGKAYAAGTLTLNVPAGTQRVAIACIATAKGVAKVINETAMNADVTSTFVKSTVPVEGANGYAAKDYNVWVFEPAVAYGNAAVLKVTLG